MRYKVTVAYDGFDFYGWQKQDNLTTIQGVIEQQLSLICDENIEIVASGRTDRFVHARGQVFHFDTKRIMPVSKWIYALNNALPLSIRIIDFVEVDHQFHSRFHAVKKHYRYIYTFDKYNPLIYRYKSILKKPIDLNKMNEVASLFIGTHDFTSFTSAKIDERKSKIKTIYSLTIHQKNDDIIIDIVGNGFLRYMVRVISQVLIEAGSGNIDITTVEKLLASPNKDGCRFKADGHGLYLMKVYYEENDNES